MNLLQTFMADGNAQARAILQELVEIGGKTYYGTFGDAQLLPVMTRNGYQDQLVTAFRASRDQFAADPDARQTLTRESTQHEYLIQMVDTSAPVIYTFLLTDREA